MKSFLSALFLFSLSLSAFADFGFDCRNGNDGYGGKYCHYDVPGCASATCEEAAVCTLQMWGKKRDGKNYSQVSVRNTTNLDSGEVMVKLRSRGSNITAITEMREWRGEQVCMPVALSN